MEDYNDNKNLCESCMHEMRANKQRFGRWAVLQGIFQETLKRNFAKFEMLSDMYIIVSQKMFKYSDCADSFLHE